MEHDTRYYLYFYKAGILSFLVGNLTIYVPFICETEHKETCVYLKANKYGFVVCIVSFLLMFYFQFSLVQVAVINQLMQWVPYSWADCLDSV